MVLRLLMPSAKSLPSRALLQISSWGCSAGDSPGFHSTAPLLPPPMNEKGLRSCLHLHSFIAPSKALSASWLAGLVLLGELVFYSVCQFI